MVTSIQIVLYFYPQTFFRIYFYVILLTVTIENIINNYDGEKLFYLFKKKN